MRVLNILIFLFLAMCVLSKRRITYACLALISGFEYLCLSSGATEDVYCVFAVLFSYDNTFIHLLFTIFYTHGLNLFVRCPRKICDNLLVIFLHYTIKSEISVGKGPKCQLNILWHF